MEESPKTVFVTRYALTSGITECEVARERDDGSIVVKSYLGLEYTFNPGDFADTKEQAITMVRVARDRKIKSLKRQIDKLEAMTWE